MRSQLEISILDVLESTPTQEKIHQRVARYLENSLSMALRTPISFTIYSNGILTLKELIKQLPKVASWNIIQLNPSSLHGFVVFESAFLFRYIELFYGGSGESPIPEKRRAFSEIERRLIKRMVTGVLEDLQTAWKPYFSLEVELQSFIYDSQNFIELWERFSVSDRFRLICFEIQVGNEARFMTSSLCYPSQPIRLGKYLSFEHPQTIALILSEISGLEAVEALLEFTEDLQADVVYKMASLSNVNLPTLLQEIKEGFSAALFKRKEMTELHPGGFVRAIEILKLLGKSHRERIFQQWSRMGNLDTELHKKIKKGLSG